MRQLLLLVLCAVALPLGAQAPAPSTDSVAGPALSLDDAQRLARRNNPDLQQVQERRRTARAAQLSAYGNLLPSADASLGASYQQGGRQIYNGLTLGTNPNTVGSSYGLSLNYRLSAGSLIAPRVAAANRDAVEADITGATETLRSNVTQQYLTVLQAAAKADLADTLVAAAQSQVALARARSAVGSATSLDVARAEVDLATQQVAALNARNLVEIEKLRLFQQMGVAQPQNVQLTSAFTIAPLAHSLAQLMDLARDENPQVVAYRAREHSATLGVRQSRAEYTPSLQVSTGWGGYTQRTTDTDALIDDARLGAVQNMESCQVNNFARAGAGFPTRDCSQLDFTPAQESAIRSSNEVSMFDFTKNPWQLRAAIVLPLFDGFSREQRVQEATARRNDARSLVRARELQLTADVTSAYLTLTTAQKTVALQEQNAARARQELTFTEERYRVGAATFLDVTQARATYERAESDRINAVYDYHKAFAALEGAVGRPLR
jgi:outer membrane protein